MTFLSSQLLLADPPVPFPASVPPAQGAIARATARTLASRVRSAPLAFVRRAGPILTAIDIAATALEVWEQWQLETLPVSNQMIPPSNLVPGGIYAATLTARFKRKEDGFLFSTSWGGDGSTPDGSLRITAPITEFWTPFTEFPSPDGVLGYRLSGASPLVRVVGTNAIAWDHAGIVSVGLVPLFTPAPEVDFAPFTRPGEIVPYQTPDIIPITPIVPRVPGLIPAPVRIPLYLPEPFRLPTTPIPILPGTPENPERDPLAPPMWVVPGGLQIGTPPGAITIAQPPGYPATVPDTATERERERTPPRQAQCLDEPEPPSECCDCDEIREIVKEELDDKFPPKRPTRRATQNTSCRQSGVIELPKFTQQVRILMCTSVINTREQNGVDAPNVRYLGWYAFGDGAGGDRLPIHYNDQAVYPPKDATTISYTLYEGNTARLSIDYLEEIS